MHSMTGFAALEAAPHQWEMRGVNGRGLEVRLRLPDGYERFDPVIRKRITARLGRGNVSLSLKRLQTGAETTTRLNPAALAEALDWMVTVQEESAARNMPLAQASAAEVLQLRGVLDQSAATIGLPKEGDLLGDLDRLLDAFVAMRATEGEQLRSVLSEQVSQIETLTQAVTDLAPAREAHLREALATAMGRLGGEHGLDEDKLRHDVAALLVKGDVTEELDRLRAHIESARALIDSDGPSGRKLDFLTQEFNREANTLCSKSQHAQVTRLGLELKAVIDQMREQVQNVE